MGGRCGKKCERVGGPGPRDAAAGRLFVGSLRHCGKGWTTPEVACLTCESDLGSARDLADQSTGLIASPKGPVRRGLRP